MKLINLLFGGLLCLLLVVVLASQASAAGCGLAARPITVVCGEGCGTQVGGVCVAGGDAGSYCFNGFGDCCGTEYTTANTAPDGGCTQGGGGSHNNDRCTVDHRVMQFHPRVFLASSCSGSLRTGEGVILPGLKDASSELPIHETRQIGGGR